MWWNNRWNELLQSKRAEHERAIQSHTATLRQTLPPHGVCSCLFSPASQELPRPVCTGRHGDQQGMTPHWLPAGWHRQSCGPGPEPKTELSFTQWCRQVAGLVCLLFGARSFRLLLLLSSEENNTSECLSVPVSGWWGPREVCVLKDAQRAERWRANRQTPPRWGCNTSLCSPLFHQETSDVWAAGDTGRQKDSERKTEQLNDRDRGADEENHGGLKREAEVT